LTRGGKLRWTKQNSALMPVTEASRQLIFASSGINSGYIILTSFAHSW